jgi:carboxymethylenebutenolidase
MGGKMVDISTRDGVADAYLSGFRERNGSRPGVLSIMDAFGLRPRIEEMVDRIAARGFVVLAPNVLYRAGRAPIMQMPDLEDPAQRDPFFARLRPAMAELTPERITPRAAWPRA